MHVSSKYGIGTCCKFNGIQILTLVFTPSGASGAYTLNSIVSFSSIIIVGMYVPVVITTHCIKWLQRLCIYNILLHMLVGLYI